MPFYIIKKLPETKKPPGAKLTHAEKEDDFLKKPYFKPQLADLGDLRTVTLGGSMGNSMDSVTATGPWDAWSYP